MASRKQRFNETTHTMTIAAHQLHYRTLGSGPPLVLIHGFGMSGHIWQPILPYLAQRYQVFIVDLPGFGRSRFSSPWRLREMAPLLITWLRKMHLSSVTLMGHSMGGAIAIHMSAYAPELVERLVLVSAAGIPLRAQLPHLVVRSVRSFLQIKNGGYPLRLLLDVLQPRPRLLWQTTHEMRQSDFRAEMAAITLPTLIIWGEDDVLLPLSLGLALHETMPHAIFVTLPDCGHRPMLVHPEILCKIVLDFLPNAQGI